MGCDIHAVIERKKFWGFEDADKEPHVSWINAGDPDLERWYDVFCILADCGRNHYGQANISGKRGLPGYEYTYKGRDGFTITTCSEFDAMYERFGEVAHTPGYATLREMQEYPFDAQPWPDDYKNAIKERWDRLVQELERVALRYDGDPDAVRLVFFFDN